MNTMKRKYSITGNIFFIVVLIVYGMAGVCAEGSCPLVGDWAFEHDTKTSVLKVAEDGTAEYQGNACTWEADDTFLTLTANGAQTRLRYCVKDGETYIYLTTLYARPEGESGSVVGEWSGPAPGKSSFVFTAEGFFLEDSTFGGTYALDAQNGTFCLMYGGMFADTTCYYTLKDNSLTVEYPWHLVKTN